MKSDNNHVEPMNTEYCLDSCPSSTQSICEPSVNECCEPYTPLAKETNHKLAQSSALPENEQEIYTALEVTNTMEQEAEIEHVS